jgi:serine/threonine protein kinase
MNSQFKHTPWENVDRETIDHVPANAVKPAQGCRATGEMFAANEAVAERSYRPSLRIGSAGVSFLIGMGAFALGHVVALFLASSPASLGATVVDFLPYLVVLSVMAGAAVFASRRISTPRQAGLASKQIAQYRLITRLGTGGMGEVYLAEHLMLKRPCAIKLIRPEQASDAQVLARFEREARATARLSHWNTVEIFDYGRTADGTFYYVMEYLPGLSFEEIVQTQGRQPAERVVHLLRQACQALREAHSIGLIHRDIKPANLFVAQRGGVHDVVKVLDFGLVKQVAEVPSARLTQEGGLSGTPLFMSPEQASGIDDVDGRSDIYSLGAVAYMLLSGRPPFEGRSPIEVLMAHARDEVRPPSEFCAEVPPDLEKIVLRCLAKKPEYRYQNMDELEHALAQCAAADRWTQSCAARCWRDNVSPSRQQYGCLAEEYNDSYRLPIRLQVEGSRSCLSAASCCS